MDHRSNWDCLINYIIVDKADLHYRRIFFWSTVQRSINFATNVSRFKPYVHIPVASKILTTDKQTNKHFFFYIRVLWENGGRTQGGQKSLLILVYRNRGQHLTQMPEYAV